MPTAQNTLSFFCQTHDPMQKKNERVFSPPLYLLRSMVNIHIKNSEIICQCWVSVFVNNKSVFPLPLYLTLLTLRSMKLTAIQSKNIHEQRN
jgi:hypothetical protein